MSWAVCNNLYPCPAKYVQQSLAVVRVRVSERQHLHADILSEFYTADDAMWAAFMQVNTDCDESSGCEIISSA